MAALGTYYYSSASFSTATALYTDADLTVFAPDGWYSDESIYRQQASGVLYAETTCPSCASPAPVPTPIVYDYRQYTECGGATTQVFRVVSGGSFPASVEYDSKCWENPVVTGSTSTVNVNGLPSYADCATCTGTPTPTPGPTPTPIPTPVPAITYDYKEYTECGGSTTQVFRGVSGYVFPSFLGYSGNCWENPQATGSTSLVDAAGLTTYASCVACTPTPIPIPVPVAPVPTVTGTEIFSTYTVGSGVGNSAAACAAQATNSMYTSRANVASIQVNDIIYTNVGLTNVWNGGTNFYGVTNVINHYPDLDSGFALLINASGVVNAIVDCTAPPPPPAVPSAPSTQDVTIRECGTTTPTYDIRISGTSGYIVGQALRITGAAGGPNPEFTGATCWEITDAAASSYDSTVTVDSADSSCGGCTPTPIYEYKEYTECYTSTTQVFRKLTTTSSWPNVIKYNVSGNDLCFSNAQTTTATSSVSIETLTNYVNCFDCESPTTYVNATAGNGWVESTACNYATSDYIFTSRANVGLIIVGDTMYANSSESTVFNGALDWYGVSNVLGQATPDYKLLINSSGTVNAKVSCAAPTPTPSPVAPSPVATTNVQIEDCNDASSTAYVTLIGTFDSSTIGLALKISGGSGGSCGSGFDGTKCWEIVAVGTASDCSVTTVEVNSSCGGCTPVTPPPSAPSPTPSPVAPTPTPTPTPVPVTSSYYYSVTRCDGGTDNYTEIVSSIVLNTGEAVFMPDNNCYEIQDVPAGINSNSYSANYSDCSTCTAASPTPTPVAPSPSPTPSPVAPVAPVAPSAPGCYALSGAQGVSSSAACSSTREEDLYFDTNNFCTATVYYGNVSGCSTPYSSAIFVSVGGNQRYWDGSAFTYFCTTC